MTEHEPVDTTLPWARRRREPITQVDAERAAYERAAVEAMTKPGNGAIHPMSITTPTYEPNRAMAPGANGIIAKKGVKQPGYDDITVDWRTKLVVYVCVGVLVLIAVVVGITLYKLG